MVAAAASALALLLVVSRVAAAVDLETEESVPASGQTARVRDAHRVSCNNPPDDFAVLCVAYDWAVNRFVDAVDVASLAEHAARGVMAAGLASRTSGAAPPCALPAPEFEAVCVEIDKAEDTARAGWIAADAMLDSLDEPRTRLLTVAQHQAFLRRLDRDSSTVGLGVSYGLMDGDDPCTVVSTACRPVIVEVYAGSPAETAGLMPRDVIVSLEGAPSPLTCSAIPELDTYYSVGDSVDITVSRDGTEHSYTIVAAKVDDLVVYSTVVDKNVGYIRLDIFARRSGSLFSTHVSELVNANVAAIVVDLRSNPGGYLYQTVTIASNFLESGDLIYRQVSVHSKSSGSAFENGVASDEVLFPMAVAVNGGSASASELFALAMRGHQRAELVGSNTYGKFTSYEISNIRGSRNTDLGAIQMTTFRFEGPAGLSSEGGIVPDVRMDLPDCMHPVGVVREAVVSLHPRLTRMEVSSSPAGEAYESGEMITVEATFDRPVTVDVTDGVPYVNLQVGSNVRQAAYHSSSTSDGVSVLRFDYTVASDSDHDGISIDADSVVLNGATIRHAAGWDAVITHDALEPRPHQAVSDIALPSLSVTGATVDEGAGPATFTVTLSSESADTVTVDYTTMGGSATEGGGSVVKYDFQPSASILTFDPTETSKTVEVVISDDDIDEFDESFELVLSGSSNALIGTISATATITDNDDEAVVSVTGPVSVDEDESTAHFTVTLTGKTAKEVEVGYATTDVSARSGTDYESLSGSLLLEVGGATSKTLEIAILDDEFSEVEESFRLDLVSAANATVDSSSGSATVSIADDDPYPELSVEGGTATEGGQIGFVVSLSAVSGRTVSVAYATLEDSASAADFNAVSGTLRFLSGERSTTIVVDTVGDTLDEPDESFELRLTDAQNATVGPVPAVGRILDDDDPPSLSAQGGTAVEGSDVTFTVSLSAPSGRSVSVKYRVRGASAAESLDFSRVSGTLTFAPGDVTKAVDVTVADDRLDEAEESLELLLSEPLNASIDSASAVGSIIDNDSPPTVSVHGGSAPEGGAVQFVVSLSAESGRTVGVDYASVDGTAVSGDDYEPVSARLEFEPGDLSRTVSVAVHADDVVDTPETFDLRLSGAVNVSLGIPRAAGTIDGDKVPDRRPVGPVGPVGPGPDEPTVRAPIPYTDLADAASVHEEAVVALVEMGAVEGSGCASDRLCPNEPILRWMIAVWMVRVVDGGDPDAPSAVRFDDVDPDAWWAGHVERLAELGITRGCAVEPARFCGDQPATRGQMAAFLARAFELAPAAPAGFGDTAGNVHRADIDSLFVAGITTGCSSDPLLFCPLRHTTKAQMATLLLRALRHRAA